MRYFLVRMPIFNNQGELIGHSLLEGHAFETETSEGYVAAGIQDCPEMSYNTAPLQWRTGEHDEAYDRWLDPTTTEE